jgi:hypothetical protein
MATMGKYCKAYPVSRLRAYPAWTEQSENLRPEEAPPPQDGPAEPAAVAAGPRQLADDDYLFVQENLIVTDGIFIDEHIIFDAITPAWEAFCKNDLQFEIPDFEAESLCAAQ